MKITFFVGSTTGGGAEHVICELASYLVEQGHAATILTVTNTKRSYLTNVKVKINTLDLEKKIKTNFVRVMIKMLKLCIFILKNKTDIYVVFLPDTIKALMLFRHIIKVPIVVSERNNPNSYTKKIQRQMIRAFSKADGTVFQTIDAFNYYSKNIALLQNSVIIPNAIIGNLTEPYFNEREKVIVSVGRFNEQKNFSLLIEAFTLVRCIYPEYKLIIYGEGDLLKEYQNICKINNIEESVFFPGFVDDIKEKIKKATVFVLSSNYEGMPNALIEAMSMGMPCVATDCDGGGARFLIENGINGILVEKNNLNALKSGIISVIQNPDKAKAMGVKALEVRQKLNQEKIYSDWLKYLQKVLDDSNK